MGIRAIVNTGEHPVLMQAPVFLGLFHVLRSFNRTGTGFGQLGRSPEANANTPNYVFSVAETRSRLRSAPAPRVSRPGLPEPAVMPAVACWRDQPGRGERVAQGLTERSHPADEELVAGSGPGWLEQPRRFQQRRWDTRSHGLSRHRPHPTVLPQRDRHRTA